MRDTTFFAAFSTLAIAMYHAPMVTMIIAIATLIALDLIGRFCNRQQQQVDQGNAAYDEIKALFQQAEDIMANPVYEDEPTIMAKPIYQEELQVEDVWETTEVTSYELACTVEFAVQPVFALPASYDATIEDGELTVVVDYSEFSYRELQAKCKALRPNAKAIKLNSKRGVLEQWLRDNSASC